MYLVKIATLPAPAAYKYVIGVVDELKQLEKLNPPPPDPKACLHEVISNLTQRIVTIEAKGEDITRNELLDLAMLTTAQKLASAMKADEAMLLPALHRSFVLQVKHRVVQFPVSEPMPEQEIPGTRWLLARLHSCFGELLKVQCRHKRYGSLLLHRDCDLLKALSTALGQSQPSHRENELHTDTLQVSGSKPKANITEQQIVSVASHLNERIHKQAKSLITRFDKSPDKYATFDLSIIQELDPVLLGFIQQLTQSVRSRKRKLFQGEDEITQTRQIRQLYTLCTVLFCTNSQCCMPLHYLLSEAILCHGGSQQLVKIFNRIGAAASLDTSQRLSTQVVQTRVVQGIKPDLVEKGFTIVSVDNIDILQRHAFVSSTDASRSWHGTSVQCVQPLPLSSLTGEEILPLSSSVVEKHPASSPIASPIPVEKAKRRCRTLAERSSPHTTLVMPVTTAERQYLEPEDMTVGDHPSTAHRQSGTSVQCVQPLPLSSPLTGEEILPLSSSVVEKHPASSPIASPIPIEKAKRRRRTLAELSSPHTTLVMPATTAERQYLEPEDMTVGDYPSTAHRQSGTTLNSFSSSPEELKSLSQLKEDIFKCVLLKNAPQAGTFLPGLPSLLNCVRQQTTDCEQSNVVYVEILSDKADSQATLVKVLGRLYKIIIIDLRQKWLLVVGDAKTFDLLQNIRYQYGDHMKWLIPFPGDWHILYNYQPALMKPYVDAGLAKLAEVSGHRSETLTSLVQCSHFKRTHNFLLQAFEAFYRYFISLYLSHKAGSSSSEQAFDQQVQLILKDLVQEFSCIGTDDKLDSFRARVSNKLTEEVCSFSEFTAYMEALAKTQDTIQFWYQFISEDCLAYVGLFTAIRYRNWDLRTGSIKALAAIFAAFDRPIYLRLIPQHLYDLLLMPSPVLEHLRSGSFSVRLSPSQWHGVALDECHEMKINKDAKLAVVHPSEQKMEYLSNYLPFRAGCVNNLIDQLFPERKTHALKFSHRPTSQDKKAHANAECMLKAITDHGMFHSDSINKGLWNFLRSIQASPEQAHDLLTFRSVGQAAFCCYIQTKLLKKKSTDAPVRKKRLRTFSMSQVEKRKVKLVDREEKLSQKYMRRMVAWVAEHGTDGTDLNALLGPISPIPRALVGGDGLPYKGTKSNTTACLKHRYSDEPPVVSDILPSGWVPDVVILEGMFLIHTPPLTTMTCMKDYVRLLLSRFVQPHFSSGANEVHLVFDNPGCQSETPKELEWARRDTAKATSTSHHCESFSGDLLIPDSWNSVLSCRMCKKELTLYIADEMLNLAARTIRGRQQFVTNIGETTYSVATRSSRIPRPYLRSNADEGDLRVWLHCMHSIGTRKLIYSPDTDVYHIGMTQMSCMPDTDVIVQLSKPSDKESKFVHMNNLLLAIENDPDLFQLLPSIRPQALQSLYVATGCDYISFFSGLGKASFLSTLFQYATFIAKGEEPPGSIGTVSFDRDSLSLYSFLRLVGCAYFRKHTSLFAPQTPVTLFYSIPDPKDTWDHHKRWLETIRNKVWRTVDHEKQRLPSTEALRLHWWRCLWVLGMWHSATQNDVDLPGKIYHRACTVSFHSQVLLYVFTRTQT